ncbi:hypothetical protein FDECE_14477, partial [Fusarium decemcellulare]
MALDENVTWVEPTGLGRALYGVTVFFLVPTSIVVFFRCYARFRDSIFGMDDGLMVVGY